MAKRLAMLLLLAFIVCTRVQAQDGMYLETPKVFEGGLILGMNFTQIDGDTYYGYHKVGLNAGAVVYIHFNEVWGVSMELTYTQKGSKDEEVTQSPTLGTYVEKYSMKVNYVEVPVTLHAKSHKFDFEAGFSYARLVNSKEWVEADQPVVIDPVLNRFNTTDLDYIFGISRKLYKNLYANVRYQYSITSIRSADRIPVGYGYGNAGQFNNMFNLRLMYLF